MALHSTPFAGAKVRLAVGDSVEAVNLPSVGFLAAFLTAFYVVCLQTNQMERTYGKKAQKTDGKKAEKAQSSRVGFPRTEWTCAVKLMRR